MYESRSADKSAETTNGIFFGEVLPPGKADISQKHVCGIFLRFRDSMATMRKSDGGMGEKTFRASDRSTFISAHPRL